MKIVPWIFTLLNATSANAYVPQRTTTHTLLGYAMKVGKMVLDMAEVSITTYRSNTDVRQNKIPYSPLIAEFV